MSRVKRFFVSHRVCFGLFIFVMAYQILVGNNLAPWRLNEHFITFYTVDYGLGFCSRFLPGAVYRLFFDQVDVPVLSAFSSAFPVLFSWRSVFCWNGSCCRRRGKSRRCACF